MRVDGTGGRGEGHHVELHLSPPRRTEWREFLAILASDMRKHLVWLVVSLRWGGGGKAWAARVVK